MLTQILIPASIVGGMGLIFGLILAFAARKFAVKSDPRVNEVRAALPGVNCGACGKTGCDAFAIAAVKGEVKPNGCPVGGEQTAKEVARILGVEVTATVRYVARVICGGNTEKSKPKYEYAGIKDCVAANMLHGGPLSCSYGCTGFGNCARACPFDAIVIENELARIVEEKCQSCERCVTACPKKIIKMVPRGWEYTVTCSSKDKGAVTRKNCSVGCIACTKCVKICPVTAITMNDNLAVIDPAKCTNCGACFSECPTGAIRQIMPIKGHITKDMLAATHPGKKTEKVEA